MLCYLCLPRSALVLPANLVQLFNAESHAIGIKPVHEIDDAIAKFVFDKCVEKMNMYISLIILT